VETITNIDRLVRPYLRALLTLNKEQVVLAGVESPKPKDLRAVQVALSHPYFLLVNEDYESLLGFSFQLDH
jgi:hypothetical protein